MDAHAPSSRGCCLDSCEDISGSWAAQHARPSPGQLPGCPARDLSPSPSPSLRTTQIKTSVFLLTTCCTALCISIFSFRQLATDIGLSPRPSLPLLLHRLASTTNAVLFSLVTLHLTPSTWYGRFTQAVQADWSLLVLMWATLSLLLSNLNATLNAAAWTGHLTGHLAFLLVAGAVVDLPPAHTLVQLVAMLPLLCLLELLQICSLSADTSAIPLAWRSAAGQPNMTTIALGPAPAPPVLSLCNPRRISLQVPMAFVCLAIAAIVAQLLFSAHSNRGQAQHDQSGGSAAGAADEAPTQNIPSNHHVKPKPAVPLHSLGMTMASSRSLHRALLAAVHWCEWSMERLAEAATKQLVVGCICVPTGMCFMMLAILARHNLWTKRLISLDECDLLMVMFFLLGRESSRLDMTPSLAHYQSHLSAARALLSDLLPRHIVRLLMTNGLDGVKPESSQGEPCLDEAREEDWEDVLHAVKAGEEGWEDVPDAACRIEVAGCADSLLPWVLDARSSSCAPVTVDPMPNDFAEFREDGGDDVLLFNSTDADASRVNSCCDKDAIRALIRATTVSLQVTDSVVQRRLSEDSDRDSGTLLQCFSVQASPVKESPQLRVLLPSPNALLRGSQSQGGCPLWPTLSKRAASTPLPVLPQGSAPAAACNPIPAEGLFSRTRSLLPRQCSLSEVPLAPTPFSCPRSSYQWGKQLLGDLCTLKGIPSSLSMPGSSSPRSGSSIMGSPKLGVPKLAESHSCLTIFFSDICGFSTWAHSLAPEKVMDTLNDLYTRLDDIIINEMPHLYKVETIGDSYMVAGNLSSNDPAHAASMVRFALRAQQEASKVPRPDLEDGTPLQLRIGLHSGPAMSGIVGKLRRRFCIFGDTVNMASRTETCCPPGSVQVTAATRLLAVPYLGSQLGEAVFRDRGEVEVKGSKLPIRMYLV